MTPSLIRVREFCFRLVLAFSNRQTERRLIKPLQPLFHTGPTHERLEFRVLRFAFLGTSRKSELPGTEPSRGGSTPTEFPFPDSVVPDFVFRIRILRTEGTYCHISQYLFMDSFERQKSQVSDSEVPGSRTTTSASTAQPGFWAFYERRLSSAKVGQIFLRFFAEGQFSRRIAWQNMCRFAGRFCMRVYA